MKSEKKRKPWNRVDEQVYSISTQNNQGKINMNIATYVVPVTMQPKRYLLAIYRNTQTHKNIFEYRKQNKYIFLQALSIEQIDLVKVLGKKTGLNYDKQKFLEKSQIMLEYDYKSNDENLKFHYLSNAAFVLLLQTEKYIELGDHDLVICKQVQVVENNNNKSLLGTDILQQQKIIL